MTTPATTRNPDDYVLSIGDFARRVGLSVDTIRYKANLPADHPEHLDHMMTAGGYRRFTVAAVEQFKAARAS